MHEHLVLKQPLELTLHLLPNADKSIVTSAGACCNDPPHSSGNIGVEGPTQAPVRGDSHNEVVLSPLCIELNLVKQSWPNARIQQEWLEGELVQTQCRHRQGE